MEARKVYIQDSGSGPLSQDIRACREMLESCSLGSKDAALRAGSLIELVSLYDGSSGTELNTSFYSRLNSLADLLPVRVAQAPHDKPPQLDRTLGFHESVLTDYEQWKLNLRSRSASSFGPYRRMMFPFLVSNSGATGRDSVRVRRATTDTMVTTMRSLVGLYRLSDGAMAIHRRILGFSIFTNATTIEIYGHYPEIHGDRSEYYQRLIASFKYEDGPGKNPSLSYNFIRDICDKFAPEYLKIIRTAIDRIPS